MTKIDELCGEITQQERILFWKEVLPGVQDNQKTRMDINSAKIKFVEALLALLRLMNTENEAKNLMVKDNQAILQRPEAQAKYNELLDTVNENLALQCDLAQLQINRNK